MEEKIAIDEIAKICCGACEMSWSCDEGDCADKGPEGYKSCRIVQDIAKKIFQKGTEIFLGQRQL